MYDIVCACGADLPPSFRFCPGCGTVSPDLLPPAVAPWASLDPRVEDALRRTLADVEDEHVGLWGRPGDISVDRVISAKLASLDWPQLMLERGWVIPDRHSGRQRLVVTAEGRRLAREYRAERGRPPSGPADQR